MHITLRKETVMHTTLRERNREIDMLITLWKEREMHSTLKRKREKCRLQ